MKNLILLVLVLITVGCSPLANISTQGLTYDGTDVYYNGELCAKFSAIELAYDNGKIVREATFLIVSSDYNEQVLAALVTAKQRQQGPPVVRASMHQLKPVQVLVYHRSQRKLRTALSSRAYFLVEK